MARSHIAILGVALLTDSHCAPTQNLCQSDENSRVVVIKPTVFPSSLVACLACFYEPNVGQAGHLTLAAAAGGGDDTRLYTGNDYFPAEMLGLSGASRFFG